MKFVEIMELFGTNLLLIGLANGLDQNGLIMCRKRIILTIALVLISIKQYKC